MKALLLALLFAPLAWAEGEARFYEVEVLIFQNARDPQRSMNESNVAFGQKIARRSS